MGQAFLKSPSVFPSRYHSTCALYSSTCCSFGYRGAWDSVRFAAPPPTSGLLTVNIVRVIEFVQEAQNDFYEHKYQVKFYCYALYLVISTECDQLWCTNKTKLASSSLSAH